MKNTFSVRVAHTQKNVFLKEHVRVAHIQKNVFLKKLYTHIKNVFLKKLYTHI